MKLLQVSLVWLLPVLFILLYPSVRPPNLTSALFYTSRNECVSSHSEFAIEYHADFFGILQSIEFTTLSPVKNCYFSAERLELCTVRLWQDDVQQRISADEIGMNVIAVKLLLGGLLMPKHKYKITFTISRDIEVSNEGLIFKVYRDLFTMKKNWYSIVKIGPANCGKVYVCINSLRSTQTLKIVVIHPKTHRLLCPGVLTTSKAFGDDKLMSESECASLYPVGVNNMHFTVADFVPLIYDGRVNNESPSTLGVIAPRNENGFIYYDILQQFDVIKKIYSMLLLYSNIRPFHVYFYALPNSELEKPEIRSGVCFFNFDNMHFQLDLEMNYRGYLRCLLHQGFLNDRRDDSWPLRYVPEGLFEKLVSSFEVFSISSSYYRDAVEGSADDLSAIAKYHEDVAETRLVRPWRKSAGFFTMLERFSPLYATLTYSDFLLNNHTVESLVNYWPWLSQHCKHLKLNESTFADLVYTWISVDGYPVIEAQVLNNRTVCVTHYNVGEYFRSYLLPVQIAYNLPIAVQTEVFWTDPKGRDNCRTVELRLYPYLINTAMNVVGRVNYDVVNWETWADELRKKRVRDGLTPLQKVQLVTDAFYFAGERKLSYKLALRLLFLMRTEVDELAWRNFDKTLQSLEMKIRYTSVYSLFKKTISDLTDTYYNASELALRRSETATKWSCMMGNARCLNVTERMVEDTLRDHRFRQSREVLCGGMRRIKRNKFHALINTMGRPDWREPDFYVDMMLCAENPKVLRDLMHHLFFHNSWKFRKSRLTNMLLKMIRASKSGSDAAFYYLNHDPEGMVKLLGFNNVLEVVQALAGYMKENHWYLRFFRRMKLKRIIAEDLFSQHNRIVERLKVNKKWYNTQYKDIQKFFMLEFGKLLKKFENDIVKLV